MGLKLCMERERLIALAYYYKGDQRKVYKAIKANEMAELKMSVNAITILDADYPKSLMDLDTPPLVLFYRGDRSLLHKDKVAVIGARDASNYAIRATCDLIKRLDSDTVIVSGLAKGIDSIAHKAAISSGHKTIAVLGSGINRCYPSCNKDLYDLMSKDHLIISEYPDLVAPLSFHFPVRNRIIAALAKQIYVMQARLKSGTFITVDVALDLCRDIYALPYNIYDEAGSGNNRLIEDGAKMILFE